MSNNNSNPWLGLKTYSEGQILYGRSEEINALSQDILFNRQTVVYGKSCIGKSSLLNAGVFPILRRSSMFPVNVRLDHKSKKISYCEQIQKCVEDSLHSLRRDVVGPDGRKQTLENLVGQKKELCPVVPNDAGESLWEYFHRHVFYNDLGEEIQPVIVFDQFEEIFTLCKEEETRRIFFDQLADLINDVPPSYIYTSVEKDDEVDSEEDEVIDGNDDFFLEEDEDADEASNNYLQEPKFHIVITLREDFLSYLERYTTNIPLLKHNRYCLRPLSDDQAGIIITDPVPGLISDDVAVEIICKITDSEPNEFKLGDGVAQLEVDSAILSLFLSELYKKKAPEDTTISIELVRAIGDNIITSFYEETIANISEQSAEYLERRLVTDDERRDSIFEDRALMRGVTKEELKYLKDERLIHEFPWNDDGMRIEFMHDILCPVIVERRKRREQKKIQEEEDRRREEETQKRIKEEEQKRLEVERKAKEESDRLKAEAVQIRRKNRRRLASIGILAISIALIVLGQLYLFVWDYHEDYGNFTTLNGWPIELGEELRSTTAKEQMIVHYRLTRKGRLKRDSSPFYKVEVVDAKGNLTTNIFHETPIVGLLETEMDDEKAKAFAKLQRETAYWIYTSTDQDFKEVARCTAYNLKQEELYSIQYYKDKTFASSDVSKYVQWAVFNDVNGKQMMVTDNGADRMRQTVSNGVVTGCLFFTELGTPQKNAYDAYGYQYEVNDTTHLVKKQYYVDKFGAKIDSTCIYFLDYDYGRVKQTSLFSVIHPQQGCIVYHFKDYNDTLQFNKNGTLGYGTFHTFGGKYSKIVFKCNNQGLPLLNQKYKNNTLTESKRYSYLSHTSKKDSILVLQNGILFTEKYSYPNDTTIEISFWKDGVRYSQWRTNEFGDSLFYHKSIAKLTTDSLRSEIEYQNELNNLISYEKKYIYSKYSKIMDSTNRSNVKLEYFYDSQGKICKSEWFDYDEYGNRIARAVAGIDGTPVRCPNWDFNHNCYYKMTFLKNFSNDTYIALKGLNEFGEESHVVQHRGDNQYYFKLIEYPSVPIQFPDDDNNPVIAYCLPLSKRDINPVRPQKEIPYLHLLSKSGNMYRALYIKGSNLNTEERLKDGDVLYRIGNWKLFQSTSLLDAEWRKLELVGGDLTILRARNNTYIELKFHITGGDIGAEYHKMPVTDKEYKRINYQ